VGYPDCDYDVIPPYAFEEHNYPSEIVKRVKGQRYDVDVFPLLQARLDLTGASALDIRFPFAREDKLVIHGSSAVLGSIEVTGFYPARNPMTHEVHRAEAVVLTTHDGILVPLTRLGPQFVLIQNRGFKFFVPKNVKLK